MAKTAKQIEGYVYRLLRDSTLYTMVTGEVYRRGTRPRDSKLEDIVVSFTAGNTAQVQTGVVTVNIFVPDVDPYDNGVMVENGERIEELEAAAQQWFNGVRNSVTEYKFELKNTIYTEEDPTIGQHFVVLKLHYERFDDDDEENICLTSKS